MSDRQPSRRMTASSRAIISSTSVTAAVDPGVGSRAGVGASSAFVDAAALSTTALRRRCSAPRRAPSSRTTGAFSRVRDARGTAPSATSRT